MNELLYHATQNANLTPEDVGEIMDLDHAMQDNYMEDRCTKLENEANLYLGQAKDLKDQLSGAWFWNREMLDTLKEILVLRGVYDYTELESLVKNVEASKHVR